MLRIFLSYSHADRERVARIGEKIISLGHVPWIDSTKLKGGQEWAREIRDAIKQSDAVVVCFSRGLSKGKSYVHREWRIALDVMQELPPGAVYIIPLRLEECTVPEDLDHLHRVDWFETDGPYKLDIAIENVSLQKREFEKGELYRQLNWAIQNFGAVIHLDETSGTPQDARKLSDYLSQNIDHSTSLLTPEDWKSIIELWAPLNLNPFFNLRNPCIQKAPVARARLQMAKSHLFFAHAWLSAGNPDMHVIRGYNILNEIIGCEPFPTTDLGEKDVPVQAANVQNENYLFLLELATRWLDDSAYYLEARTSVDIDSLRDAISRRKAQLRMLI